MIDKEIGYQEIIRELKEENCALIKLREEILVTLDKLFPVGGGQYCDDPKEEHIRLSYCDHYQYTHKILEAVSCALYNLQCSLKEHIK